MPECIRPRTACTRAALPKRVALLVAAAFIAGCASSSKPAAPDLQPRSLSEAARGLVQRLDAATAGKGSRFAVATLVPTGASERTATAFGEYVSDTLADAIRTGIPRARLYERKRIDLILEENQLAASGLVDEDQALKIGNLAPIDALLTGTYTVFESYVDINCRLVDISTGMILFTHIERIRMDTELAALIRRDRPEDAAPLTGPAAPQVKSAEELCKEEQQKIETLLKDLSSPEKISAAVKAAEAVPFDAECGEIHFTVMQTFKMYKVFDPGYRRFLLAELAKIAFPSNDDRAYSILSYLATDNGVDQEEWKAGLEVVKKAQAGDISTFLVILLETGRKDRNEAWYAQMEARVNELVGLVKAGKVGLPIAATMDQAYSELLDAFNYSYTTDNRPLFFLLDRYGAPASKTESLLTVMYPRETDPARKLQLLDRLSAYFHSAAPDDKAAEDYFGFLSRFEITEYTKNHPEEAAKYPQAHLPLFINKTRDLVCAMVARAKFNSQKEDRIDFCLVNGIECPGVIPTAAEMIPMLRGEEWNQRVRASEMLDLMGPRAAPAEDTLVRMFDDEEGGSDAEIAVFRGHVVRVLGAIKTAKPASLQLLLDSLSSFDYGVSEDASRSLGLIGAPAVPYLIRGLASDEGGVQYYAASALAKIGPAAKEALPALRKLAENTNTDLRSIAKKAIAAIEGTQ